MDSFASEKVESSDTNKEPQMRSGLKPYVFTPYRESSQKTTMPDVPTTADHFIPYMTHDVAFTSLRLMVFKVEPRSATPIAHLLREQLGDASCFELLNSCHASAREQPRKNMWKPSAQDEYAKVKSARYGKLSEAVEKARKVHARRLRDADMEDIEITYFGQEATLVTFMSDKEQIQRSGGKAYHLWPLDQKTRIVGMSVLIKSQAYAQLYPAERLELGGITIETNTAQAPPESSDKPRQEARGSIFPYDWPDLSGGLANEAPSKDPEKHKVLIDKAIARICGNRPRSSSLQALKDAEKGPWHSFASGQRPGQSQPEWSPRSMPFTSDEVADNNAWWLEDFETRKEIIGRWERSSWRERLDIEGEWERRLSDKSPQESVANVDYELVEEMSQTYVSDSNPKWHKENIETPAKRDNADEPTAQARQDPGNLQLQHALKDMMANQFRMDQQLESSKIDVIRLRKNCGYTGTSLAAGLADDINLMRAVRDPANRHVQQPKQKVKKRVSPNTAQVTESTDAKGSKHERTHLGRDSTGEHSPPRLGSQAARTDGSSSNDHEKPVSSNVLIPKVQSEARGRKEAQNTIPDILDNTVVRRKQDADCPSTSLTDGTVGSPPPSPVTPSDWLGTPIGIKNKRQDAVAWCELQPVEPRRGDTVDGQTLSWYRRRMYREEGMWQGAQSG